MKPALSSPARYDQPRVRGPFVEFCVACPNPAINDWVTIRVDALRRIPSYTQTLPWPVEHPTRVTAIYASENNDHYYLVLHDYASVIWAVEEALKNLRALREEKDKP